MNHQEEDCGTHWVDRTDWTNDILCAITYNYVTTEWVNNHLYLCKKFYTINVPLGVNNWIISNLLREIIRLFTPKGTIIVLSHSFIHRNQCFILVYRQLLR